MTNEAYFSVTGFVATTPKRGMTKAGDHLLSMRIGWTPRLFDRATGEWKDQPSSFANVTCFRKTAENGAACLHRGDPIVVKGTLRIREYESQGVRRTAIDIIADSIGHDLARGISSFTRSRPPTGQTALEAEQAAGIAPPGEEPPGEEPPAEEEAAGEVRAAEDDIPGGDLEAMVDDELPVEV